MDNLQTLQSQNLDSFICQKIATDGAKYSQQIFLLFGNLSIQNKVNKVLVHGDIVRDLTIIFMFQPKKPKYTIHLRITFQPLPNFQFPRFVEKESSKLPLWPWILKTLFHMQEQHSNILNLGIISHSKRELDFAELDK